MFPIIRYQISESIEEKFDLPPPHEYSQSWETEVSVPDRIEELLEGYKDRGLNDEEKVCLIPIILNSYVNLDPDDTRVETLWQQMHPVLEADQKLHRDLIAYYADGDNAEEDSWLIAPRLRKAFPDIVNTTREQ